MTADRDVRRVLTEWLDEQPSIAPGGLLDPFFAELGRTPQRSAGAIAVRRALLGARTQRLAIAAALIVGAVLGILGLSGGSVMPRQAAPLPTSGPLEPRTYRIDDPPTMSNAIAVDVPSGWWTSDGFVYRPRQPAASASSPLPSAWAYPPLGPTADSVAWIVAWAPTHVYTDICHWQGAVAPAATVDSFISALSAQAGRVAAPATSVTIDGRAATRLQLQVQADVNMASCDYGILHVWPDPGPDETGGLFTRPAQTDVVYALEDGGHLLVIDVAYLPSSSARDREDLHEMVDSLRLEP